MSWWKDALSAVSDFGQRVIFGSEETRDLNTGTRQEREERVGAVLADDRTFGDKATGLLGGAVGAVTSGYQSTRDIASRTPIVGGAMDAVLDVQGQAVSGALQGIDWATRTAQRGAVTSMGLSSGVLAHLMPGDFLVPDDSPLATLNPAQAWGNAQYVSPGQFLTASVSPGSDAYKQAAEAISERKALGTFSDNWLANLVSGSTDAASLWFLAPEVLAGKTAAAGYRARNFETPTSAAAKIDPQTGLYREDTGLGQFSKWAVDKDATTVAEALGHKHPVLAGALGEANTLEEVTIYMRAWFGDEKALQQVGDSLAEAIRVRERAFGFAQQADQGGLIAMTERTKREIADLVNRDPQLKAKVQGLDPVAATYEARLQREMVRLDREIGARQATPGAKVTEEALEELATLRDKHAKVQQAMQEVFGGGTNARIAQDADFWLFKGSYRHGTRDAATRQRMSLEAAERKAARRVGEESYGGWAESTFQRVPGVRAVKVWEWMGRENPRNLVLLAGADAASGSREVLAYLTNTPARDVLGSARVRDLHNRFLAANSPGQRLDVLNEMEEAAALGIGRKHGLSDDQITAYRERYVEERDTSMRNFRDSGGYFVDDAGETVKIHMTETELANMHPLMDATRFDDWLTLLRARETGRTGKALTEGAKQKAADVHDALSAYWRPAVLIRPAYTPRTVGDGLLRGMFALDGYFSADRIARGLTAPDSPVRNWLHNRSTGATARRLTGRERMEAAAENLTALTAMRDMQAAALVRAGSRSRPKIEEAISRLNQQIQIEQQALVHGKRIQGVTDIEVAGETLPGFMSHPMVREAVSSRATAARHVSGLGARRSADEARAWQRETFNAPIDPDDLANYPGALAHNINSDLRQSLGGRLAMELGDADEVAAEIMRLWRAGDSEANRAAMDLGWKGADDVADYAADLVKRVAEEIPTEDLLAIAKHRLVTEADIEQAMVKHGVWRVDGDVDGRVTQAQLAKAREQRNAVDQEINAETARFEKVLAERERALRAAEADVARYEEAIATHRAGREPLVLPQEADEILATRPEVLKARQRLTEAEEAVAAEFNRTNPPPVRYPDSSRASVERRINTKEEQLTRARAARASSSKDTKAQERHARNVARYTEELKRLRAQREQRLHEANPQGLAYPKRSQDAATRKVERLQGQIERARARAKAKPGSRAAEKAREDIQRWQTEIRLVKADHQMRLRLQKPLVRPLTDKQQARLNAKVDKAREALEERLRREGVSLQSAAGRALTPEQMQSRLFTAQARAAKVRTENEEAVDLFDGALVDLNAKWDNLTPIKHNLDKTVRPTGVFKPVVGTKRETHGMLQSMDETRQKYVQRIFETISINPEDMVVRIPYANARYRQHLEESIGQWKRANPGKEMPNDLKGAAARQATRNAVQDTKDLMYTIERVTNLQGVMRFVSPFFTAIENTWRVWGRMVREDPSVAGRMVMGWQAPGNAGLLQDRHGNPVEMKPGQMPPGDAVINMPLPAWMPVDNVKLSQKGINVLFQDEYLYGYGPGPTLQIPVAVLLANYGEHELVQALGRFTNMSGRGTDDPRQLARMLMPTYGRHAMTWIESTVFGRQPEEMQALIRDTVAHKIGEWERGGRVGDKPTTDDVIDSVRNLFLWRAVTTAVLPTSHSYQLSEESAAYQALYQQYMDEGTVDGVGPIQRFLDDHPEMWAMLGGQGEMHGIVPTQEAARNAKEYRHLAIEAVDRGAPEMLGVILNHEEDPEFDADVYRSLLGEQIDPGRSDEHDNRFISRKTAKEALEDAEIAQGWREWTEQKRRVDERLVQMGVSLQSAAAEEYRVWLNDQRNLIAELYPAWDRDRKRLDTGRKEARIDVLEALVGDEKYMSAYGDRPKMQAIDSYLDMWHKTQDELASRKAMGESGDLHAKGNADLFEWYQNHVYSLVRYSPDFGEVYNRYLDEGVDSILDGDEARRAAA